MFNTYKTLILPVLILIMGIFIIQYHSIMFWTVFVNRHIGFLWSIILELAAIWLWIEKTIIRKIFGLLTSIIILTGPIFHLIQPIIKEYKEENINIIHINEQIKIIEQEQIILQNALTTYLKIAENRQGWNKRIDETQSKIISNNQKIEELKNLKNNKQNSLKLKFENNIILIMEVIGLFIIQMVNIFIILYLKKEYSKIKQEKIKEDLQNVININTFEKEDKNQELKSIFKYNIGDYVKWYNGNKIYKGRIIEQILPKELVNKEKYNDGTCYFKNKSVNEKTYIIINDSGKKNVYYQISENFLSLI